ncbi:MAG: DegT/DnrJ/EryC1/StrS family aminotransferase [Geobacteraceae bacterium]
MRHSIALFGGTTNLADCMVAVRYLCGSRHLIRGPVIEEYEKAFARVIGVHHAFSFSTGRVGFYGLLNALEICPGDEVLLQVPTHIVVVNAIRYTGARPVFVDCDPYTYNMDLEQAEQKISPRTKVLLIQHTFGNPVDMDLALSLANRYGLTLIEDCVHALGAKYDGKLIGSFGMAAFFSTEETKTISTTMGGMVVTDDADLAIKMRKFQESCSWPSKWLTVRYLLKLLTYHVLTQPTLHRFMRALYEMCGRRNPLPRPTSSEEEYGMRPKIYEQRLSNVQAILGLRQLHRLGSNLSHRRITANLYLEHLSKLGFRMPKISAKAEPAFVRFPLWVEDRTTVVRDTASCVVMGLWFTSVLQEAVSPEHGDYLAGSCPQAEAAAAHLVNLPTHLRVQMRDAMMIISAVARSIQCQQGKVSVRNA